MATTNSTTIKIKRDPAATWTANNITLDLGEPGIESDTHKMKIGNGTSTWNSLSYVSDGNYVPSQLKRDMAANLASDNPVLAAGELAWESDTGVLKIGDGTTYYNDISAMVPTSQTITRSATIVIAASDSSVASKAQADYVCDGTADDIKINAAINTLSTTGGTVVLLSGNYYITDDINPSSNTTIKGEGKNSTVITRQSGDVFLIYQKDNVKISDLSALTTTGNAYDINHSTNVVCVDTHAEISSTDGVDSFGYHVYYSNNVYLDRCTSYGDDPTSTHRSKCFNPSTSSSMVYISNCHAATKSNGTEKSATGFEIDDGATNVYINNFQGENLGYGVDLHTHGVLIPSNIHLTDVRFYNTANDTISICGTPDLLVKDLVIENAYIDTSSNRGLFLSYASGARINGITIKTCTNEGIRVQDSSYVSVSDSDVSNCLYGIYDLNSNMKIINPLISNCTRGVYGAGGSSVSGGVIYSCGIGAYLRDDFLLTGVTILNSTTTGITIYSSTHSRISGNYVYSSGTHGIYAVTTASGSIIENNTVDTALNGRCIHLSDGTGSNIVVNNYVSGSSWSGAIQAGTGSIVENNNGYISKKSGTATIVATTTSITVTHGLATAPTHVIVSPKTNLQGKSFWASDYGTTTFIINISEADATNAMDFNWSAVV